MPVDPRLLDRSAELKQALLAFIRRRQFRAEVGRVLDRHFPGRIVTDEGAAANAFDYFLLQHRLPDGGTVIDHYLDAHPRLPEADRALLLSWKDVVEGLFEVTGREDDALMVVNLLDGLTYRVRSNMGPGVFARMGRGSFLYARLVPLGDGWLISGSIMYYTKSQRDQVYQAALQLATVRPSLTFRNPEKLARAWELQRQDYRDFVDCFGTDTLVVPGAEAPAALARFARYKIERVHQTTGRERDDLPGPPEVSLPEALLEAATVGILYDETEGMYFLPDYQLLDETFADPDLATDRAHREAVRFYVESPDQPPFPIRRLAARDPERAERVIRTVFKRKRFSWERDGEALLRRYKPAFYDRPPLPSIAVVPDRLAEAQRRTQRKGPRRRN